MSQASGEGKSTEFYEFKGRVQGWVVLGPSKASWRRRQEPSRRTRDYLGEEEWKEFSG